MPCAKNLTSLIFFAYFSKILINKFPIIFLFFSGSFTFLSLFRNKFFASTYIRLILNFFLNVVITWFSSFFLNKPVFTKIHVSCLPIALWINLATTLLSTPPDKAQITFDFPTFNFTSLINVCFWFLDVQFLFILQILKA